jgi:hypothetical protein
LLRVFKKQTQEGYDVVPAAGYPAVAAKGQQLYNKLTLASDPRKVVERVSTLPPDEQAARANAINLATTRTKVQESFVTQLVNDPTSTPALQSSSSDVMVRSAFCQNKAIDGSQFSDTQFAADCGVCLSSGTVNSGLPFTGPKGLFIDPSAREQAYATKEGTDNPYTNAKPTTGTCVGATGGVGNQYTYALDKNEYDNFTARIKCQHDKNLDGTCGMCLQDGSFTYVGDTGQLPLETLTFYVGGKGTLSASMGGQPVLFTLGSADGTTPPATTVVLSSTPTAFQAVVAEGALMSFNISQPNSNTPWIPAEFYGVLEAPSTTGGVTQIPLDKLLLTDDQMGGKPRRGRKFPVIKSPAGEISCAQLVSGYSKPSMMLTGIMPFLFASSFPFDGIDCKGSILQSKSASAAEYAGDPCYKPGGQGPGNWSAACVQDRILNAGCTVNGTLYKSPPTNSQSSIGNLQQQFEEIAAKQYSDNDSSIKCNGKKISTPCDSWINYDVNNSPDISPQCINYLYYNGGDGIQTIGPTYTGPVNTYYSLDGNRKKIHCLPGAGYDPMKNPNLVAQLQQESRTGAGTGQIGIPYIQQFFNKAFQRATNTGLNANLPDAQGGRGDSIAQCFASLAKIPQVQTTGGAPSTVGQYVRVRYPPGRVDYIQIAQVAVYDTNGNNIAQGKPTTAASQYIQGVSNPANAVDGVLSARGPAERAGMLYTSAARRGDYWMVNLGSVTPITKIVYYNRSDGSNQRSEGMLVEILDSNQAVVWSQQLKGYALSETLLTNTKPFNI